MRLATVGDWAFLVAAAHSWNILLHHVTLASSLSVFRVRLKTYYPHMLIARCGYISVTVYVFFLIVRLWISLLRIKLAASNLHGNLWTSKAGNLPFLWTYLSQKPKIGRIGQHVFQLVTPRCLWNIARHVDVGLACVDRGQSPLTYLSVVPCVIVCEVTSQWLFVVLDTLVICSLHFQRLQMAQCLCVIPYLLSRHLWKSLKGSDLQRCVQKIHK